MELSSLPVEILRRILYFAASGLGGPSAARALPSVCRALSEATSMSKCPQTWARATLRWATAYDEAQAAARADIEGTIEFCQQNGYSTRDILCQLQPAVLAAITAFCAHKNPRYRTSVMELAGFDTMRTASDSILLKTAATDLTPITATDNGEVQLFAMMDANLLREASLHFWLPAAAAGRLDILVSLAGRRNHDTREFDYNWQSALGAAIDQKHPEILTWVWTLLSHSASTLDILVQLFIKKLDAIPAILSAATEAAAATACGNMDKYFSADLLAACWPLTVAAAAQAGNGTAVRYLLACRKDGQNPDSLRPALRLAVLHGRTDIVNILLEAHVPASSIENEEIVTAAENGHLGMVQLVGQLGCGLQCLATIDPVDLIENVTSGEDAHALLKLAFTHGMPVQQNSKAAQAIILAVDRGWVQVIQWLIENGADVNASRGAALYKAACEGLEPMVNLLMTHGASAQLAFQGRSVAPTVELKQAALVKLMLEHGADPDLDKPLTVAVKLSDHVMVTTLLAAQCRVPLEAIEVAAQHGNEAIVRELLASGRTLYPLSSLPTAYMRSKRVSGTHYRESHAYGGPLDSALWHAAANGREKIVEALLQAGADPTSFESMALRTAARDGYATVVQQLLTAGADVHADEDDALASASQPKVLKILLAAGADPRSGGCWPLIRCETHRKMLLDHILSRHARSAQRFSWNRPEDVELVNVVSEYCPIADFQRVLALTDGDLSVGPPYPAGDLLVKACQFNRRDVVALLLDRMGLAGTDADRDQPTDGDALTPQMDFLATLLQHAGHAGSNDVVEELVARGADEGLERLPLLRLAVKRRWRRVVEQIVSRGHQRDGWTKKVVMDSVRKEGASDDVVSWITAYFDRQAVCPPAVQPAESAVEAMGSPSQTAKKRKRQPVQRWAAT